MMNQAEYRKALAEAISLGQQRGRADGSWVTDGNTTLETYVKLARGIDDGDPEIMDALPSSPLSGEWADDLTPKALIRELGWDDDTTTVAQWDALLDAYEQAYSEAVVSTVYHACQVQLEPEA